MSKAHFKEIDISNLSTHEYDIVVGSETNSVAAGNTYGVKMDFKHDVLIVCEGTTIAKISYSEHSQSLTVTQESWTSGNEFRVSVRMGDE